MSPPNKRRSPRFEQFELDQPFMINLRVKQLNALFRKLVLYWADCRAGSGV
jgi:hypothetical protein